jgi:hypothetical protein
MGKAGRRGRWLVVAASGAAHLAVLTLVALNRPSLPWTPPPPVFEVEVVPRFTPEPASKARPQTSLASRPLRPRRTLSPDETSPVAPLITRDAPGRTQGAGVAEVPAPAPAPAPAASPGDLAKALRRSPAGCANADAVRLTKAEREGCLEMFGQGAKDAPFFEPPMSRDKRQAFNKAAARKEAYVRYRNGGVPVGRSAESGPSQPPVAMPEVWRPRN